MRTFGNLTKMQVAEIQFNTSIEMLFSGGHPVAIHTLAAAATEVVRDLAAKKDLKRHIEFENLVAPERRKEFFRKLKAPANFFKHAKTDSDSLSPLVNENLNDLTLFWGVSIYYDLGGKLSAQMNALTLWIMASHGNDLLLTDLEKNLSPNIKSTLNDIREMSRSEALRFIGGAMETLL